MQDAGYSTKFADKSRSCQQILTKFLTGDNPFNVLVLMCISIQPSNFSVDNCKKFVGQNASVEICGFQVLPICNDASQNNNLQTLSVTTSSLY